MKLAVAIITRNRAALLPRALDSALSQRFPDKAVWVLDDASEDDTPRLAERYPAVRWVRSGTRLGIPSSRAHMLDIVPAEYLCNLDDDAWFLEDDALAAAVDFLDANPGVGVAGFDVVAPGRDARRPRAEPAASHTFSGCAHVLRVSAARGVGGFTAFPGFYGCEEKDLAIRLMDAGHEVVTLTGVHAWHDKTAVARDLERQHASGVCNDLFFARIRFPMPDLLWSMPSKIAGHLLFSLRNRLMWACARGVGTFAKRLREARARRAPVRRETLREFKRRMRISPRPVGRDFHPA